MFLFKKKKDKPIKGISLPVADQAAEAINRAYLKCKQELFDYYFKYADETGD